MILTSQRHVDFYSSSLLHVELLKHRNKVLKLTKLSASDLDELEQLIIGNITFINEELIPKKYLSAAQKLTNDIDEDDMPFVALTSYLNGLLWTGDKRLIKGLESKGFIQTITTSQLSELFDKSNIG